MGKINVEAEKNELILENEFGDKVIIPAKKRQWVQKQIEKGNHADLDNYISTLPIKSDFAEEGSVVPGDPTKKVKVYTGKPEYFVQGVAPRNGERKNEDGSVSTHSMSYTSADDVHYAYPTLFQDGDKWIQLDDKDDWAAFKEAQKRKELFKFDNEEDAKKFAEGSWKTENIKEYDIDSPEYRELYNSGAITNYDKNSDTYILSKPLDEVVITAEAPQWAKDKRKYESQYTKDWYIDNKMPKFSRSMGVSADNMHPNNVKEYDSYINDKVVEDIFKSKPTFDEDYSNDRLKTLQGFSQKELAIIKDSSSKNKISPSFLSSLEQNLLSIGNVNPVMKLKNSNLTNEEAQKEDTPFGLLERTGELGANAVRSVFDKDYTVKQFLSGKQSDATTAEKIAFDVLNLVGAGAWGKLSKTAKLAKLEEGYQAIKAGSKVLNKTDDAVNNINRIKFDDFKNDNEFFRIIVGDEAFDDIVQTQKIRTKQPSSVKNTPPNTINLDRRGSTAFPSFSKGSPSLSYANDNPNHYIIRTADESIKPSTSGRHGKGTTMFPTDKSGKHLTELDASKVQVYKHVGNGEYELVNTAKPIVSSVDNVAKNLPKFKSEINWSKWNKEIPNNKPLMEEYNAIEETTKANGTWMKNPDGSNFDGTPEQFIQQLSSNFKKAFPTILRDLKGNIQKTYHGSPNTFTEFDPNVRVTGRTRGEGYYTSPKKDFAENYAKEGDKKLYEFYQNEGKKQDVLETFNKKADERFAKFLKENPKDSKNFGKKFEEFMKKEDEIFDKYLSDDDFKLLEDFDFYIASPEEYVSSFKNLPKSAIGNNGMFDMNNPNIFKGLIPPALLYYLQSQQNNNEGKKP